jgi:hypothetical protein
MPNFTTARSRGLVVVAAAALLAVGAGSGAVADSLLTGADIKDRSIEAQDLAPGSVNGGKIKDNAIKLDHLSKEVSAKLGAAGKDGAQGPAGAKGDAGAQGPAGPAGAKGTDGLVGAKYRTMTYLNGGGGSATVACADDAVESQKYTAISGGVQGSESGVSEKQTGFLVSSSFPGRMNWDTGKPRPGRLDGWIVFGNSQYTSTLTVWALCVPNTSIGVDAGELDN